MNSKKDKFKDIQSQTHNNWSVKSQRILKSEKENKLTMYKGSLIRITANLSLETMETRKQYVDTK